jgi:hypothetical protein
MYPYPATQILLLVVFTLFVCMLNFFKEVFTLFARILIRFLFLFFFNLLIYIACKWPLYHYPVTILTCNADLLLVVFTLFARILL